MSCSSDNTSPALSPRGSSGSSPDHSPNKQAPRRNLIDTGVLDIDTIDAVPFPFPPRRNVFIEPGSGMRDVPMWLKGLRLHKYTSLFQQLSYDQMMSLTETQLDMQGVTKGARHKIVTCVQKLRERTHTLRTIETDLADPSTVRMALNELRTMVYTPIRPFPPPGRPVGDQALIDGTEVDAELLDDENLPAHITRVVGKISQIMFGGYSPGMELDLECATTLMHVLDRAINHEAFTQAQKRRLVSWKQNIKRVWNPPINHYPTTRFTANTTNGAWRRGTGKWSAGELRGRFQENMPPNVNMPPFPMSQNNMHNMTPIQAQQLVANMSMSMSMYQQLAVMWANYAAYQQQQQTQNNGSVNCNGGSSSNNTTNNSGLKNTDTTNFNGMDKNNAHATLQRAGSMPASCKSTSCLDTYDTPLQLPPFVSCTDSLFDSDTLLQPIQSESRSKFYATPSKQPVCVSRSIPRSPWSTTSNDTSNCHSLLLSSGCGTSGPLTVDTNHYSSLKQDHSLFNNNHSPNTFSLFNTPTTGSCSDLNLKMEHLCRSMAEQVISGNIDSPLKL